LVYDILSNTRVLSVKENLNKLDIIYDGQNLKEKKENLTLLTVKISNEGNRDIKENDYFSKIPFGLKINHGKIAEKPLIIDASSKFLRESLAISYDTLNTIQISKVPFNSGQYFTLKILTICGENTLPTITPVGNISGINNDFIIRQTFKDGQKGNQSFLGIFFSGGIGIHVARFFFYLLCAILIGFLIGMPISKISSWADSRHRRRMIKKFREKTKINLTDNIELIFDLYKSDGKLSITWLHKLLQNNSVLLKRLTSLEKDKSNTELSDFIQGDLIYTTTINNGSYQKNILELLVERKIVIKTTYAVNVDAQFKNELSEFNYFIDIQ